MMLNNANNLNGNQYFFLIRPKDPQVGAVAQSVQSGISGEEVLGSIPAMSAMSAHSLLDRSHGLPALSSVCST